MTALLLRPHLWNGMRDPYLYEVEACGNFRVDDALTQLWWRQKLAIYDLRVIEKKGIFLNDAELPLHVVEYHLPWESGNADQREEDGGWDPEMVTQDLELLACMGSQCIAGAGGAGLLTDALFPPRSVSNVDSSRETGG